MCMCDMCSSPAGFGRSSGAVSWHIRVFPRLAPRPVPRIIMVLLRARMCVYFTRTLLHFPSFPLHSRSALCLQPVVPSVNSVCVCVYVRALWASEGKSILCKLEREQEKKIRGWQWAEGQRGGRSGMEMILCVCVTANVYLCVWAFARELQSQPLIWPLPGNMSVLWFDTVCVCVCVNWKAAGTTSSFTGSTLWSWNRASVIWFAGVERAPAPDLKCARLIEVMLCSKGGTKSLFCKSQVSLNSWQSNPN